jgi:hypothetical protein
MSLNIACWNCRGVMTATPYISKLLHNSKVDISCLSEHWLRKCQFNFLQSIEQNYSAYGKGVDEHCPGNFMVSNSGGVAVLVSNNLATYVTEIEVGSTRICRIELKLPNSTSIFFLCVYLPAITQPFEHFVNETEYLFDIYNSYSQHGTVFLLSDLNCKLQGPRHNCSHDRRSTLVNGLLRNTDSISLHVQDFSEGQIWTYRSTEN